MTELRHPETGQPYEGDSDEYKPPDPFKKHRYVSIAIVVLAICCILALSQVA